MKYDLNSAPRHITWKTKWAILFGGLNQLWWILAALFLIPGFITYFNLRGVLDINRGNTAIAHGVITDVGLEITSGRGKKVYEVTFNYTVDHHPYTDRCSVSMTTPKKGTPVKVIHSKNYPEQGYIPAIKGCVPESTWSLYLFAGPGALFLLILLYQLLKGFRRIKLVTHGESANGTLFLHERYQSGPIYDKRRQAKGSKTPQEFNLHTLTFEYEIPESRHKQYLKIKTFFTRDLTDEPEELILYHPQKIEQAILFDTLPGDLKINRKGNIETGHKNIGVLFNAPLAVLISPVIGYAFHFVYFFYF